MSEELFDVVFFGILQPGKDKETAMQNMAALFKTDAAKLAPYFAGGRKVIKGNINAAAAEKYKTALENIGLSIKLEAAATTPDESAKATNTPDANKESQDNKPEIDTTGLSIAAAGSDVIENPVEAPVQKIDDISSITMAEAGANVIENPTETPAQKIDDISDITMAETGSDVLANPSPAIIPQKIDDIPGISLAESGADLIENPAPEKKAEIPDTSELSLND